MSAGDPGTIWSERMNAWIMDPNFVGSPTTTTAMYVATALMTAFQPTGSTPALIDQQAIDYRLRQGEDLIAQITFWREIPLIGTWVARRLSQHLDILSNALERATN